jgi:DNA-binding response OmpR family regulator
MTSISEDIIRIWIAEDDDELREILGTALKGGTRDIRLFQNGQSVIDSIQKKDFDILITDLMMPGADGIQILKEVKRFYPESIVIIMTGYASLDSAIQAIRGGAYDYIRKPFKLDELEIIINNACEKISLQRENRRLIEELKETKEELNSLRTTWDDHLSNVRGMLKERSHEETDSDMEFLLHQINPLPPDYDLKRKESQENAIDNLERLIYLRKTGFLSEEEFLSLKKKLLDK